MATIAVHTTESRTRSSRTVLDTVIIALLGVMAAIWTVFQIVEIKAPFPPIGILYALGSVILAVVLLRSRKTWVPAVVAGWAAVTMIPESIPAIDHLRDWSELYTHFGHYLIIMTFFPLAILLVVVSVVATVRNREATGADAPAPTWLRPALLGVSAFIIVANAVTIVLYALEIP